MAIIINSEKLELDLWEGIRTFPLTYFKLLGPTVMSYQWSRSLPISVDMFSIFIGIFVAACQSYMPSLSLPFCKLQKPK